MKGYYCIIQYMPCPGRRESLNLGAFLFNEDCSHKIVNVHPNYGRIAKCFGLNPGELQSLKSAATAIASRLSSEDFSCAGDVAEFTKRLGNAIQMTLPRFCRIQETLADTAQSLVRELVEFPAR